MVELGSWFYTSLGLVDSSFTLIRLIVHFFSFKHFRLEMSIGLVGSGRPSLSLLKTPTGSARDSVDSSQGSAQTPFLGHGLCPSQPMSLRAFVIKKNYGNKMKAANRCLNLLP